MTNAKIGDRVKFSKFASSGEGIIEKEFNERIWVISGKQCFKDDVTEILEKIVEKSIPAQFLDWCADNCCWRNGPEFWYSMKLKFDKDKTTEELFKYWNENVYGKS